MKRLPRDTDFSQLPTAELIESICWWGMNVPLGLAEAILARGSEAVPSLCEVVSSPKWWAESSEAGGPAVIHAMHLLGAIGDPAAAAALLVPMERDEPTDYLTESMPGILSRLGEEAIPTLRRFVQNPRQDSILRTVVFDGLVGMAMLHPELTGRVQAIGRQLAIRCLIERQRFPASLGYALAKYGDPGDLSLLKDLCHSRLWDDHLAARWENVLQASRAQHTEADREYLTRDPMAYFAPDRQKLLHKQSQELRAAARAAERASTRARSGSKTPSNIGRNDPCPCGSGRKHKKCCGRGTGAAAVEDTSG